MFKIHTDETTLSHSKTGVTKGTLYITINDRSFPNEDWDDAVITICIGGWTTTLG